MDHISYNQAIQKNTQPLKVCSKTGYEFIKYQFYKHETKYEAWKTSLIYKESNKIPELKK